jgi:hypothetical protein
MKILANLNIGEFKMSESLILEDKNDLEDIVTKKLNQVSGLVVLMQAAMDREDSPSRDYVNNAFWLLIDTIDDAIKADKSLLQLESQERNQCQ